MGRTPRRRRLTATKVPLRPGPGPRHDARVRLIAATICVTLALAAPAQADGVRANGICGKGASAQLRLDEHGALAAAEASDARRKQGNPLGPLDGVPVAVKDIFLTEGVETTCASRVLQGFRPPYDATTVRLLKEAGTPILGKLNQDEFAMGSSNESSAYGPCHNPWDVTRTPGGSSGGSAAALASAVRWSVPAVEVPAVEVPVVVAVVASPPRLRP